jgi:hypothetical protein
MIHMYYSACVEFDACMNLHVFELCMYMRVLKARMRMHVSQALYVSASACLYQELIRYLHLLFHILDEFMFAVIWLVLRAECILLH